MQQRIILLGGGAFQDLAANQTIMPSDLIVYADVAQEIEKITAIQTQSKQLVVPLILGLGETIPTMLKRVTNIPNVELALAHFKSLPAIDLARGMGQWPFLGRCAVDLIDHCKGNSSESLETFCINKMFNSVYKSAGGVLTDIEMLSLNSLSGGSGGGVGHTILQAALSVVHTLSETSIKVWRIRMGAATFNGLGNNIWSNAGPRIVEELAHLIAGNRLDREIRLLWLFELPILGNDKPARDLLTTQFVQALFSFEVQNQIDILVPNVNDTLDGAKILKMNWWHSITSRVASAENYVQEVRYLLNSVKPDSQVCEGIRVDTVQQGTALDVTSIWNIINNERRAPTVEELKDNLVYPTQVWVLTNRQDTKQLTEHELNKPARTPENIKEYLEKAGQYTGLIDRLRAEHDKINQEYIATTERLNGILNDIQDAINQTGKKQSWWSKTFGSGKRKQQGLIGQAFTQATEYYRLKANVEALAKALDPGVSKGALRSIQALFDLYKDPLRRLEKNLKDIIGESDTRASAYVRFKPFADLFKELISLSEANQIETMAKTLDNSVKNITDVGIAIIVGLQPEETDPLRIVHALLNKPAPFIGPAWGGRENTRTPIVKFLVFPPMEPELAENIKTAMAKIGRDYNFACSDGSAGGLNVVEINIYQPVTEQEIITPQYYKGLQDALKTPYLRCLPDIDTTAMLAKLDSIYAEEEGNGIESKALGSGLKDR